MKTKGSGSIGQTNKTPILITLAENRVKTENCMVKSPSTLLSKKTEHKGVPFSKLYGGLRIGHDFLHRVSAIDSTAPVPAGLTDNFDDFKWHGFDTDVTKPAIKSFYEQTINYRVLVKPRWQAGFKFGGRVFRWLSRRVQQMGLPVDNMNDREMVSQIEKVNDNYDGRSNVRSWVRTYRSTGETVYVALYATHYREGIPYMNIAFPLPAGNLTSILRVDPNPTDSGGLVLSTLPRKDGRGDEGIYFANRLLPFRLPFNETITVWQNETKQNNLQLSKSVTTDLEHASINARHDIWLFGIHFLALDYRIERNA